MTIRRRQRGDDGEMMADEDVGEPQGLRASHRVDRGSVPWIDTLEREPARSSTEDLWVQHERVRNAMRWALAAGEQCG